MALSISVIFVLFISAHDAVLVGVNGLILSSAIEWDLPGIAITNVLRYLQISLWSMFHSDFLVFGDVGGVQIV